MRDFVITWTLRLAYLLVALFLGLLAGGALRAGQSSTIPWLMALLAAALCVTGGLIFLLAAVGMGGRGCDA